jgi:hypothetical protein
MQTLVKISPLLLLAACTFDSSALDSKDGCRADDDCASGVCIDATCRPPPAHMDAGGEDVPLADTPENDVAPPCDAAAPNACGGCGPLELEPGAPCPDSCGTLYCGADGETLVCEPIPSNPCGGCIPLGARPGSECGSCGEWACGGDDALVCEEVGRNECGGCEPLDGSLAEPCGTCDGDWMCDGENALACVGGDPDPCGTCDGPSDVDEGDICACEGDYPARWACASGELVCDDGADSVTHPVALGTVLDNSSDAVLGQGSLHSGDDTDWFVVDVTDTDDLLNGLFPTVVATDVPADRRICAFWQYDDRRDWRLLCGGESIRSVIEGARACCIFGDSGDSIAIMQDVIAFERLDDILAPGTAAGTLHVGIESVGEAADSCTTYTLELHF